MSKNKKRTNGEIIASRISVISETGEQLGEMSRDEALEKARQANMDLVEVGMRDKVVVAKIMDYGKELFKQKKNQQKSKSSSKRVDLKTLRISYKIWEHDLEIRRKQAEKFAKAGHMLKIELLLRGRERAFADVAREKIIDFSESLEEIYKVDQEVKTTGHKLSVQLSPKNR